MKKVSKTSMVSKMVTRAELARAVRSGAKQAKMHIKTLSHHAGKAVMQAKSSKAAMSLAKATAILMKNIDSYFTFLVKYLVKHGKKINLKKVQVSVLKEIRNTTAKAKKLAARMR